MAPGPIPARIARFAIPAGVAIGVGIIGGSLIARYGFNLGLTRSRTGATGIVVVCGLAVVMGIESRNEKRRLEVAGRCVLMLLIFALVSIVPFLRHFYELATPRAMPRSPGPWALALV